MITVLDVRCFKVGIEDGKPGGRLDRLDVAVKEEKSRRRVEKLFRVRGF